MKRHLILLSAGLFAFLCIRDPGPQPSWNASAQAPSEETTAAVANEESAVSNQIDVPEDLNSKFETLENPPLALGSTGDRVRELQATLNAVLGGRPIQLGVPILVGPAGPSSAKDPNRQVRIVYIPRRDKALQIRGDWVPSQGAKEDSLTAIVFPNEDDNYDLQLAPWLELPDQPLKVDGVYGQHTQAAVALFQIDQSLPITGEVDPVTLDKLEPLVPANPLLAAIMGWFGSLFASENDNYPVLVKTCTSILATLLILAASTIVFQVARIGANSTRFLSRWLFTPSTSPWFTALRNRKVFLRAAHFGPALFIYCAGLLIFPAPGDQDDFPYLNTFQDWHEYVSRLGLGYVSIAFMVVGFACASAFDDIYNPDKEVDNPITGITRASKRFIGLLGSILILASLAGRNPLLIVGGLGGFMAVIMLVFRDYLLGLVASIQIITNKVVKVGDWIAMPKYNADGDVKEMSLTLIKVQNFDKTVSTIPTNSVLTESFRNWTAMQSAGGRRIKRSILIDIDTIHVCTPEMIDRFERVELIRDYIQGKKADLEEYNRKRDVEASPVNSRRLTNIGTFRAYLLAYLSHHSGLSDEMTFLVRHLQPTHLGLPIEIYAFCRETDWDKYESVQADIFDHVLAVLPEFGLKAFQDSPGGVASPPGDLASREHRASLAEIDALVKSENRKLQDNPRFRLETRVEKVRARIRELGLADDVQVSGAARTITLCDLSNT